MNNYPSGKFINNTTIEKPHIILIFHFPKRDLKI